MKGYLVGTVNCTVLTKRQVFMLQYLGASELVQHCCGLPLPTKRRSSVFINGQESASDMGWSARAGVTLGNVSVKRGSSAPCRRVGGEEALVCAVRRALLLGPSAPLWLFTTSGGSERPVAR